MRISDWSSDVCSSDLSPARSGFQAEALETPFARRVDDIIKHVRGDALPQEGFGGAHRLDLAMLRIEHFERAAPREFVIAVDRPEGHVPRAEAVDRKSTRLNSSH